MTSLAIAVVVLLLLTLTVAATAGLNISRAAVTATVRAVIQLAAVGFVIAAIFRTPQFAPFYLMVVLAAAAWTSGRRIDGSTTTIAAAAAAIALGVAASGAVVFGSGALAWRSETAVPFLAQLAGGSMTAATLAGRRLRDDVVDSWTQVEGWLALGANGKQAVLPLARRAASRALEPALDQTRMVGLVTLPGAYVGLLLGGATPVEAGKVQLLVLVGLIAAETISAVTFTRLLAPVFGTMRPSSSSAL